MEMELLRRLAAIDSPTLDVDGVNRAQDVVVDHLSKLGFRIGRDAGDPRFGDFVVAERAGRTGRWITLVGHVDTVLANYRSLEVDSGAGRAFGSGVIDNKGGVAVGLGTLSRLFADEFDQRFGIRFLSSPNEEMGSVGFISRYRDYAASTAFALGLEPALDDGSIIHQRRGNRWYSLNVVGREAHAGRSYGKHANAAHELAEKIVRLSALTDYRRHVSVTIGAFGGGKDRYNIVCGDAHAKLDVRFPTFAVRDRLHRKIEKILGRTYEVSNDGRHRAQTTWDIVDDCPPFGLTSRSKRLARVYCALVGELEGRPITSRPAGGAGDVNYLSTSSNVVLDGFGPVGGEMHTLNEYLSVATLESRARALAHFVKYLQAF